MMMGSSSVDEKMKSSELVGGVGRGQTTLLEEMKLLKEMQDHTGSCLFIISQLFD